MVTGYMDFVMTIAVMIAVADFIVFIKGLFHDGTL